VVRQSAGSSQSFVQLAERRSSLREAQESAALGLRALLALAASATALPTAKVVEALAHGRCTPTAAGTSAWEARAAVGRALCVLASLAIGRGEVKVGKQYAEMGVQVSRSAAVSHCEALMPAAHWLNARRRSVSRPPSLRQVGLSGHWQCWADALLLSGAPGRTDTAECRQPFARVNWDSQLRTAATIDVGCCEWEDAHAALEALEAPPASSRGAASDAWKVRHSLTLHSFTSTQSKAAARWREYLS
jgi:hypothetical protein